MDMSAITTFISSVGFPIACCIYLIYSVNKTAEKHMEETEKLRETVDNNTKVMMRLCSKLGMDYDKGD